MLRSLRLFILLFALPVLSSVAVAEDLAFFDQTFGDFSEELATARAEGKKAIFIFFEMDECPFCHRMKTTILNQPDVIAFYKKNFKMFQLDIEGDVEITDFQGKVTTQKEFAVKKHRVRATPVMAFFDLNGNRIVRYTGATSTKEEFMLLAQYVISGAYNQSSFTRYKREQRKNQ